MWCPVWDSQLVVTSNNTHEYTGMCQYRGTATMAFHETTSEISGLGYDASGLERWLWIKLQGKYGKAALIITTYNPCKINPDQPSTVYMQHKRYLMSVNQDIFPCEAMCNDLYCFITACQNRGDQIVLCVDLNKATNREEGLLQQTLLCNNNLVDALKYQHQMQMPTTHNQ